MNGARRAIVLAALAAPALGSGAPPATGAPKKVAICLGPSNAPDPFGPTRKAYAKEFATHGLSDGKEIEIVILRPPGPKWTPMAEDFKRAVSIGAHVIMRPADGDMDLELLLPIVGDTALVIWAFDGIDDSVETMSRRGVNVTGVILSQVELISLRFALLKELRPAAKRVAIVGGKPPFQLTPRQQQRMELEVERYASGARAAGMELVPLLLDLDAPVTTTIAELRKAGLEVGEFPWGRGTEFWDELAAKGIAATSRGRNAAKEGALLSAWGIGAEKTAVRLAAKVLRGQRASSIPVERLREYRLAINLRTARKLGITVPPAVMLRMHEVFE